MMISFWNYSFLELGGETIKFSSFLRKKDRQIEKSLINDINHLENTEIANFQLLSDKEAALEVFEKNEYKVK